MTSRRARKLAGGSLAISGLLCVGAAAFLVLGWNTPLLPNDQSAPASGTLVIGRIPVTREAPG